MYVHVCMYRQSGWLVGGLAGDADRLFGESRNIIFPFWKL